MKVLSLFSGVGAFEKALTNIGVDYELVGFSEIDKWAIESYSAIHNVNTNKNLGDVSEIAVEDIPDADLVTYGFPCQDVSVAGQGKGIREGTRSGLLYEAERIIDYIKPKYAIAENVKNLIGKRHRDDFDKLLERLDDYGYNNYWEVLNAKDFGVPQNRERVFVVSIRKDIDDEVFKFPEGKDSGVRLKDMLLKGGVEDKYYIENERTEGLLNNLVENNSMSLGNINPSGKGMNGNVYNIEREAPTLTTNKGEGVKIVDSNNQKRLGGLYDEAGRRRQAGAVWDDEGVSPTLCTMQGGLREPLVVEPKVAVREATEKGYDIAKVGDSINVSFPNSKTRRGRVGKGVAQTLETQSTLATLESDYSVRKLTPLECWRLMGFEDEDYWIARRRLEEKFYNGGDRSNSQMYKQAGNSIVVDVLEAIFKNLLK